MKKEFYLWCDYIAGISDIEMKEIRENASREVENFKETGLEGICKNIFLNKKIIKKLNKTKWDKNIISDIKISMEKKNISFLTIDDPEYPELLKGIYDPPYILYYMGDISLLKDEKIIAVVGSRNYTDYGFKVTTTFVTELTRRGYVIVSGLAKGVDSTAHGTCIKCGGKTIAVLGTSIDKIYPADNIGLLNSIVKNNGLVISENKIGTPGKGFRFAKRNRIISGISKGVLITEAKEKSGALITADCALQQNREVYAVPGSIFSPMSIGCNKIISEGAKMITKTRDILEDMEVDFNGKNSINQNNKNKFQKNGRKSSVTCVNIGFDDGMAKNLSEEEILIINLLSSKGAMNIDELSIHTGFTIDNLSFYLNKLCMLDMVVEQGFNTYAPNIL